MELKVSLPLKRKGRTRSHYLTGPNCIITWKIFTKKIHRRVVHETTHCFHYLTWREVINNIRSTNFQIEYLTNCMLRTLMSPVPKFSNESCAGTKFLCQLSWRYRINLRWCVQSEADWRFSGGWTLKSD